MSRHDGNPGRRTFLKRGMAGLAGAAFLSSLLKGGAREGAAQAGTARKSIERPLEIGRAHV